MNPKNNWYEIKIFSKLDKHLSEKMDALYAHATDLNQRNQTEADKKEHFDKFCSSDDIEKWILAFYQDKIIGRTAVFKRQIKFKGRDVSLGGIGKVKVRDEHRRKGVATAMMKAAMSEMQNLDCDVAYLCTNKDSFLAAFYQKFGFEILKNGYTFLGKSGKQYFGKDGFIAPIKSKKIVKQIQAEKEPINIGVGNW